MTGSLPDDKDKDRRVTLRSAVIALSAALTAAIIAAGSSYLTAQVQVNGQARQARTDFIRSQRQIAYTQFLDAEKNVFNSFESYVSAVSAWKVSDSEATELYNKAIDAQNHLTAQEYTIQLVGSDQCVAAVLRLVSEWDDHLHQIFAFQMAKASKKSPVEFTPLEKKVTKTETENIRSSLEERISFLSCARLDMGR